MTKTIFMLVAGLLIVASCISKQVATETASTEVATKDTTRQTPPQCDGKFMEVRQAKMEVIYANIGLSADQKPK